MKPNYMFVIEDGVVSVDKVGYVADFIDRKQTVKDFSRFLRDKKLLKGGFVYGFTYATRNCTEAQGEDLLEDEGNTTDISVEPIVGHLESVEE